MVPDDEDPAFQNNTTTTGSIEIILPNSSSQHVPLQSYATVYDLKIACEGCVGIPTEIQKLLDNTGVELQDHSAMPSIPRVQLQVPIWWHKCICSVLNNELQNVYRRVQLPMQHVGQDERVFVALFMGCCRGMDKLVSLLVQLQHNVDIMTDSGRTLFHACALGGNLKCLDIIAKHLLRSSFTSFESRDANKETAYEIAQNLDKKEVADQLLVYMNNHQDSVLQVTNAPRQRQANLHHKINNCTRSNERFGDKDKQNHEGDYVDSAYSVNGCPTLKSSLESAKTTSYRSQQVTIPSIMKSPVDDDPRKPSFIRPKQDNLLIKIHTSDESSVDKTENTTRLPSLTGNTLKAYQRADRASSLPNSPIITPSTSPVNEYRPVECQSAPNSPVSHRSNSIKAVGLNVRFAVSPLIYPPNSTASRMKAKKLTFEPAPPSTSLKSVGEKWKHFRRGSLAMNNDEPIRRPERKKSRSVCEVTLRESFNNNLFSKTMDTEERMELPWNAWIAARRQDSLPPPPLTTMREESQLQVPQSPNTRRRSFVQWLNDKDLDQLRQQHAESQLKLQNNAENAGKKGKSFEEWLEDKHMDSKVEKEKEKEKEGVLKSEEEKKMRRRRISQQKYQSWLQEKELKALETEEKLLGEAKQQFEKMKIKWEEEDEMKKKFAVTTRGDKVNVTRTNSCPTSGNRKISRQRLSSLQFK